MTAEIHARLDESGIEIDADGETRDHITLLAAYAHRVAKADGDLPAQVLQRARSRASRNEFQTTENGLLAGRRSD